jgi:hypothetical protein
MAMDSSARIRAGISIAVIILCAGWLAFFIKGKLRNPGEWRDMEVLAIDSITGEKYVVMRLKDEKFPLKNPDTKMMTLWPPWICYDENKLFPGKPSTLITACPHCGSGRVGGATIDEKDLEVMMPEE